MPQIRGRIQNKPLHGRLPRAQKAPIILKMEEMDSSWKWTLPGAGPLAKTKQSEEKGLDERGDQDLDGL